jgi:hypothetical protein
MELNEQLATQLEKSDWTVARRFSFSVDPAQGHGQRRRGPQTTGRVRRRALHGSIVRCMLAKVAEMIKAGNHSAPTIAVWLSALRR